MPLTPLHSPESSGFMRFFLQFRRNQQANPGLETRDQDLLLRTLNYLSGLIYVSENIMEMENDHFAQNFDF